MTVTVLGVLGTLPSVARLATLLHNARAARVRYKPFGCEALDDPNFTGADPSWEDDADEPIEVWQKPPTE